MAIVNVVDTQRFTNVVEYKGGTMTAVNDEMRVHAHASEFTFAFEVSGGANFQLAFEASFNGGTTWYELDTSKTINSDGEYVYYYTGRTSSTIRCRLESISSGTPTITPHIAVTFNG
jgi:hypothetical protein